MASVWYIGTGWQRKITAADWATAGISGRPTVEWNKTNGWSIPHSQFTTAQLTMLDGDANFLLNQPDGPRTKPAPAPDPETDNQSAYGYYMALKNHILGNPGVYKGEPGDKGDKGDDGDEGPPGPPGPIGTALFFKGLFNAETHAPFLADITGKQGDAWLVEKEGIRNFGSGNIELFPGEWLLHNGVKYIRTVPELIAAVGLVIFHGSNAEYGRPGQAITVIWVGEVTPNNIIDGDVFINIGGVAPNIVTTVLNSMNVGAPFSQMIHADGTVPMVWSLFSGSLPAGIVLSTEGNIHGTPSASGAYSFTLKAVNAYGEDTQAFSGTVGAAIAPTITTSTLNTIYAGVGFSQTLAASGSAPITWSVQSGTLPTGLTLNTSTGTISGTPSATGAYSFTIRATNGVGYDDQAFTGSVSGVAPIITVTTLGSLWRGFAPTVTSIAASGSATITYAVTAGSLPAGLSLNTSTGEITGTPSSTGSYSFTVTATNSYGSDDQAYSGTVLQSTPSIVETSLNAMNITVPFAQTLTLSSGGPTITWSVQSGSLPTGLTLNTSNGTISGTPTVSGAYSFTIRASNGTEYDDQAFSGTVAAPGVELSAAGPFSQGTGTTHSTTGPVAAVGDQIIIWVQIVKYINTTKPVITCTYDGVPLTELGYARHASTNPQGIMAFAVEASSSGAKAIELTADSSIGWRVKSVAFNNASEIGSIVIKERSTITSGQQMTHTASAASNSRISQCFGCSQGTNTAFSMTGYNQTERHNVAGSINSYQNGFLVGDAPGEASVDFQVTGSASLGYVSAYIEVKS